MAEYLIQGDTLSAIANKLREKLELPSEFKYTIDPNYGQDGNLAYQSIEVEYVEYVDSGDGYEGIQEGDTSDSFVAYDYLENEQGEIVPVLFKTDLTAYEEPDNHELFFYEGIAMINDVYYDKWRKIEDNPDGNNTYVWGDQAKKYVYTNRIVLSSSFYPAEFPERIDDVYTAGYEAGVSSIAALTSEQINSLFPYL